MRSGFFILMRIKCLTLSISLFTNQDFKKSSIFIYIFFFHDTKQRLISLIADVIVKQAVQQHHIIEKNRSRCEMIQGLIFEYAFL